MFVLVSAANKGRTNCRCFTVKANSLAALAECGNQGCDRSPAAPARVNPGQLLFISTVFSRLSVSLNQHNLKSVIFAQTD